MTWLIILIVTIVTILITITMIFYSKYNKLKNLKENTNNAFELVDKNLTKRFELIPDLLDSVKDTMKYEDKIISEISNSKEYYFTSSSVEDKSIASEVFATNINSLFTISEAYPELSYNSNFLKAKEQLNLTQDEYENSIKIYNNAVQTYNNAIISFPETTIAHLFKFEKASFFEQ